MDHDKPEESENSPDSESYGNRPMWNTIRSIVRQISVQWADSIVRRIKPNVVGDISYEPDDEEIDFWVQRVEMLAILTDLIRPALVEESIAAIPVVKVTQEMVIHGEQCPFCHEKFVVDDEGKKLKCDHLSHQLCLPPSPYPEEDCPLCQLQAQEESEEVSNEGPEEDVRDEKEQVGDGVHVQ